MCKVYKSVNKLNTKFMGSLFALKNISIHLRARKVLVLPDTNSSNLKAQTQIYIVQIRYGTH